MFSCCCDPKKDNNNVNIFTNSKILTTANNNNKNIKKSNFFHLFNIKPKNKNSKIYNNKNILKFQENNKSIIEEKSESDKSYLTYKDINNIFHKNDMILNQSESQINKTTNLLENIKFSYYDENEEENLNNEFDNKNSKNKVKFDNNILNNKKKASNFKKTNDKMNATEIINLINNISNLNEKKKKKNLNSLIEHSLSFNNNISSKSKKSFSSSKTFTSKNSSYSSSSGYEDNDKKNSTSIKKNKKKKKVKINDEKNLIVKKKKSLKNFDNSPKHNLLQRRRSSVLNLNYANYSNQKIKDGSRKNSILSIYDKSLNLNEYRLFSLVSLNNHFLSRDELIKKTKSKNEKFKLDNLNELNNNINNSNILINNKIKFLYLTNYAGNLLIENLTISPIGLCNNKSERNMKDTLTFFGYSGYKNINDYVLNNTTFIYNNRTFTKTLFAISYDINCSKYFIQPIIEKNKQGRFIYFKLTSSPYYFINSKLILINKTLVQFISSSNLNNNKKIFHLLVKIYEKDIERSSNFTYNNFKENQQILIGYDSNADIRLKSEGIIISSFYCKIFIDTERELWGLIGKGIWMVLDQKTSINKYLLLKIGDEIIKISLKN